MKDIFESDYDPDSPLAKFKRAFREPTTPQQERAAIAQEKQSRSLKEYGMLRKELTSALSSAGFEDFDLFGAGKFGERLPPLEYTGSLRVVGPPERQKEFISIVGRVASESGFEFMVDRPPSVTFLRGEKISKLYDPEKKWAGMYQDLPTAEAEEISKRPFIYIYKTYRQEKPLPHEVEKAREAGMHQKEMEKMRSHLSVYENRVSEVASTITDDPNLFEEDPARLLANSIIGRSEFKLIREEMIDASRHKLDLFRTLHMPVEIGDYKNMVYFLSETNDGSIFVNILGCPDGIAEGAINIICQMMANDSRI
jgi:hypothetical protein